ncbi:hypothetical protein BLNAU_20473 [Blattamonas nauphoetae]|uniref:Uncharacterized protein n=1 Tax=Blattamonas nauphoetae TaxID=2049346 RepID=A0ABQ9WYM4_9EUKA|nr:hypothetical protein BLNAU_20473 [Blattamonas nauphoetae]
MIRRWVGEAARTNAPDSSLPHHQDPFGDSMQAAAVLTQPTPIDAPMAGQPTNKCIAPPMSATSAGVGKRMFAESQSLSSWPRWLSSFGAAKTKQFQHAQLSHPTRSRR